MARNTSLVLNDHFAAFVDEQVKSGRYGSVSEVVREGLRLLEDREARLAALRAELVAGERSSPPAAIDIDDFLAELRAELTK